MKCREIQELLPGYSAEALSRQRMRRVREHLEGCAACAGELARLGGVMRLVERWGGVEPPPGLWQAVSLRIGAEARGARRERHAWTWWSSFLPLHPAARLASAGIAAAALVALFWGARVPEAPRPDGQQGVMIVVTIPTLAREPEMVAAVQQHSLASAGLFLADRAGFESVVQMVRRHGDVP
jgi:hypothetical protein